MLNRSLVIKALEDISDKLFEDKSLQTESARAAWHALAQDPVFAQKVKTVQSSWLVPLWGEFEHEQLDYAIPVSRYTDPYQVISVDGSQIYPDRHQNSSCFLINIGIVILNYRMNHLVQEPRVQFSSVPHILTGHEEVMPEGVSAIDLVNNKRQEFELATGYTVALEQQKIIKNKENKENTQLLVYDGSLIFWHLDAQNPEIKNKFLLRYLSSLYSSYESQIVTASLISLPKSRELVNLVKLYVADFDIKNKDAYESIEHCIDTTIGNFFLRPYTRTTVFAHRSPLVSLYPENIKPYFFYMHIGIEIVRVEIPKWVAQERDQVDMVASVMLDQCIKGRGYPVAIAEAHEQAVVKGPDRDFFYHVLTKIGFDHKQRPLISQKSLKKRGMGI